MKKINGEERKDTRGKKPSYPLEVYGTKEHKAWVSMCNRANKTTGYYKHIGMCNEWKDYMTFLKDMGKCPEGYSLDRRNNKLGYNKSNCHWISLVHQQRNKRNNRPLVNGMTVGELCKHTGVARGTVYSRMDKGMSAKEAILHRCTQPNKIKEILSGLGV